MDKLQKARKAINEIDVKMAELFEKRMRAAAEVAEYKKEHGLKIFDPKREAELIRQGSDIIEDSELREYYVHFLKNNMEISKKYQQRLMEGMIVAYSGTEGAFAHIAARRLFPTANHRAYSDFASAYNAVANGECDAAVLPLENSYNGEVGQVTDLMLSGSLFINGTVELDITPNKSCVISSSINIFRYFE